VLPTPEVVRAVAEGRADAGVARTPAAAAGVRARTLRVERQGVVVRAGDPLAQEDEVALALAAQRPILVHARAANPLHHDQLVAALAAAGAAPPRLVERPVAFDPGQRLIRAGSAIGTQRRSSASPTADDAPTIPIARRAWRWRCWSATARSRPRPTASSASPSPPPRASAGSAPADRARRPSPPGMGPDETRPSHGAGRPFSFPA